MQKTTAFVLTSFIAAFTLLVTPFPLAAGHGNGHGHAKGHSDHAHGSPGKGYINVNPYGLSFGYQGRNFSVQVAPPLGNPGFFGPPGVIPQGVLPYYDYSGNAYYDSGVDYVQPGSGLFQPPLTVPDPGFAPPRNELPVTPETQPTYQMRAEQAFRLRQYEQAVRLARHALVEDGKNGKSYLLLAQALFATGDYQGASDAVHQAVSRLDRTDWGYVVQNFRSYYTTNDYVLQMDRLTRFVRANPDAAHAHFLRGYHFLYLGHKSVAERELEQTLELDPDDELAAELLATLDVSSPAVPNERSTPRSRKF